MKIIAISSPDHCPQEAAWIERLLDAGLARYHVRKPGWSADELELFLGSIPESCRGRILLHQHHALVSEWALGGWHFKDDPQGDFISVDPSLLRSDGPILSRSLHRIDDLETDIRSWDAVLLSPIFPSISKPGHQPRWEGAKLVRKIAALGSGVRAELFALGGVHADNAAQCRAMGFDGVVLHGVLWQSEDPIKAFEAVKEVLR